MDVKRSAFWLAAVLGACHHDPSPREDYAHGKRCYAALDANLKIVPADRFRQLRLDPGTVEVAASDNMEGAYQVARQMGMAPDAISRDLAAARADYVRSHSWQEPASGRRKFVALGHDFNECLLDYYGRPND